MLWQNLRGLWSDLMVGAVDRLYVRRFFVVWRSFILKNVPERHLVKRSPLLSRFDILAGATGCKLVTQHSPSCPDSFEFIRRPSGDVLTMAVTACPSSWSN